MTQLISLSRIAAIAFLFAASVACAAALIVTNTNNSGLGSLNQAITDGNNIGGTSTIIFDLPGGGPHIIELTSQLPFMNSDIQIINDNAGDEAVTVRRSAAAGTPNFSIFGINPDHTVLIAGLTISNGRNDFFGGGISNDRSTLALRNCALIGNTATLGGGIYNATVSGVGTATLTLVNCTLSGNSTNPGDSGGAIHNQAIFGDATVSLTNCILTGNSAFGNGGGINNVSSGHTASVTLNDCVVSDNSAGSGGGIANRLVGGTASLMANNCTFTGNRTTAMGGILDGVGGGIYNESAGSVTVTNSTLSGNSAVSGGAIGIVSGGATVALSNNTFSLNDAIFSGGGLYNSAGITTVTNCTVSGNTVSGGNGSGGGIYNEGGNGTASMNLINSTISGNSASSGGGISNDGSQDPGRTILTLVNSILKAGQSGSNIVNSFGASVNSLGHNLSNDSAGGNTGTGPGGLLSASGDIRNTDPRLGPLASNGGPTQTHALLPASPAINAGDDAHAPSVDQRGFPRVGVSDIGAFESQTVMPTILANISTRLLVETGDNVLIGGFIITGTQPKKVIVRALGPSLTQFGIADALANPVLELHGPGAFATLTNDNWRSDQEAEIIATGIPPTNDLESAIVATLPANNSAYTAIVRGVNNSTGIGVVEAYDLDHTVDSKLGNIATRGLVQTGDNVLIAGTIVLGQTSQNVIVLALGPSLGIPGELADPTLELRDANGGLIRSNDNWRTDQEAEIIATGIPPSNDLESAIVATLPANGALYTAIVRGVNGTTGVAVVEVFALN